MADEVFFVHACCRAAIRESSRGNFSGAATIYGKVIDRISFDLGEPFLSLKTKACLGKGMCHFALEQFRDSAQSLSLIPQNDACGGYSSELRVVYKKMVQLGNDAFDDGNYTDAMLFFNAAKAISDDKNGEDAALGCIFSKFRKDNKQQSWLLGKFKQCEFRFDTLNAKRFHFHREGKHKLKCEQYEKGINDIIISCVLCNVITKSGTLPGHFIAHYKTLGKAFMRVGKTEDALTQFDKCQKLCSRFYLDLWMSQKSKGFREIVADPVNAKYRFRLTSMIMGKRLLNDTSIKIDAIKLHRQLFKMEMQGNANDNLLNCINMIVEYLTTNSFYDEELATDVKEYGNRFLKKKNYSFAKIVYKHALDITPNRSDCLQRDLLSNMSYVHEVSGDYTAAVLYAKKCINLRPNWAKGYLRLGKGYHMLKKYKLAHEEYCKWFEHGSTEEISGIISYMFINMAAAVKNHLELALPVVIKTEHINKCILLLLKTDTAPSLDALNWIFTLPRICDGINAETVPLARIIKHGSTAAIINEMIDRGAKLVAQDGSPSPLDAALSISHSREASEIVLTLIKRDADVSKYIPALPNEPYVHKLVRLCLQKERLNVIEAVIKDLDLKMTDQTGNNILHLLATAKPSTQAKECLQFVIQTGLIDPKSKNNASKTALDLIKSRTDARRSILEVYERNYSERTKKSKKKERNRKKNGGHEKEKKACPKVVPLVENEGLKVEVSKEDSTEEEDIISAEHVLTTDHGPSTYNQTRINVQKCIEVFVPVKIEEILGTNDAENKELPHDDAVTPPTPQNETEKASPNIVASNNVNNANDPDDDDDADDDDYDEDQFDQYKDTEFKEMDEFEGLPWDVQCTSQFLKKLKDNRLEYKFKRKIISIVQLLATGDWRRKLSRKLDHPGIRLYKARITKAARMIWEEAIAFSGRRTLAEAINVDEQSVVYSDVIRIWDFTFDHDEVPGMINRIVQSRIRGQSCAIKKKLKTMKNATNNDKLRFPRVYLARDSAAQERQAVITASETDTLCDELFSPSASPNEREFHILKFYTMSTAMAKSVLHINAQSYDFPFEVSELELYIIQMQPTPPASILLLGRSGTGKTTCCLYRLWSRFKGYWENAVTAGPHIPNIQFLLEAEEGSASNQSVLEDGEQDRSTNKIMIEPDNGKGTRSDIMSCGCKRDECLCAIAIARANYGETDNQPTGILSCGCRRGKCLCALAIAEASGGENNYKPTDILLCGCRIGKCLCSLPFARGANGKMSKRKEESMSCGCRKGMCRCGRAIASVNCHEEREQQKDILLCGCSRGKCTCYPSMPRATYGKHNGQTTSNMLCGCTRGKCTCYPSMPRATYGKHNGQTTDILLCGCRRGKCTCYPSMPRATYGKHNGQTTDILLCGCRRGKCTCYPSMPRATYGKHNGQTTDILLCGCRRGKCTCSPSFGRANKGKNSRQQKDTNGHLSDSFPKEDPLKSLLDIQDGCEKTSNAKPSKYRHLRQLFITKNKVLCHEVKKNFNELCIGLPVAKDHVNFGPDKDITDFNDVNDLLYPLFLGSRDLLLILDASLPGKSFFARDSNGKLLSPIAGWGEKESHLSFLPVLDSDQESDDDDNDDVNSDSESRAVKVNKKAPSVKREVSYAVFVNEVWPIIERKFLSGYHPSLVWTEFRSFIKGTVEALVDKNGCMSKHVYDSMGRKKAPNFSGDRVVIYDMFKRYKKICFERNLFDEFDLLFSIYSRLSNNPIQSWLFDEIYVDETQDFTEAELFTLVRCCQDPNKLFFTGDTAQSIMRGVTFRFSDLRSLFFNAQKALKTTKSIINVPSEVHQLTYNYRSHKGILNLASSIVDLLGYFFPESFDRIQSDVGLFDGPKPVILEISDFSDLAVMLRGARRKTSPIEFGAHQVVLVSSESSKEKLPEELSCALVLTIYEAKGLEFDDVLLYNFFKDSQAKNEWRVVSNYVETDDFAARMKEQVAETYKFGVTRKGASDLAFESRPLEFEYNKHKILNSELKQLYTALTRARVNVWIYDEDIANRAPMFDYFQRMGLVNIMKMKEGQSERLAEDGLFAEKSTEADWDRQGQFFYKKELWSVAHKCFNKANNKTMLSRCEAYMQAAMAYKLGMEWRETKSGTQKRVKKEYLKAAELFLLNGMEEESITCLRNAKEWMLLGDLLVKIEKYRDAGRFYTKAEETDSAVKASNCFKMTGDYRNAIDILYKRQLFEECVETLKDYEKRAKHAEEKLLKPPRSTMTMERIVNEATDACYRRQDQTGMKKFLNELPFEKQIAYLNRKQECEDLKLDVYVENGRAEDAAQIYIHKRNYMKAASCTEKDSTKAVCLLEHARQLWMKDSKEQTPSKDEDAIAYLGQCKALSPHDDSNYADACFLLWAITNDCSHLREATSCFEKARNGFGLLLCRSVALDTTEIDNLDTRDIFDTLSTAFTEISNIFSKAAGLRKLQEFFGIEKITSNEETQFFVNKSMLSFRLDVLKAENVSEKEISKMFEAKEEQGNAFITRALLPAVHKISSKLNEIYNGKINETLFCERFLQGTEHTDCTIKHEFPNGQSSQQMFDAHLAAIQLHGATRKLVQVIKRNPVLAQDVKRYSSLKDCDNKELMMTKCDEFYEHLIKSTRYLSARDFPGLQLVKSIPEWMHHVKEQLLWFSKSSWEKDGDEGKYSDINMFLKAFNIANYAGDRFMIFQAKSLRNDIAEYYRKAGGDRKDNLFNFNDRDHKCESFHTLFLDSKEWLHDHASLLDSLHFLLRRALAIPVTGNKTVPLPSLTNALLLLEFSLSLCLMSLSRTVNPPDVEYREPKENLIYLPDFYSEGVTFWSGIYENCRNPKHSAWESVRCMNEYVSLRSGTNSVRNLIKIITHWLILKKYKRQDLFREAFSVEGMRSGESERFLIFVLVLLSNYELFSPVDPTFLEEIVAEFCYFASVSREFPPRVQHALKECTGIRNSSDAIGILGELLKNAGNELFPCTWKTLLAHYGYVEPSRATKKAPAELKAEKINPRRKPNRVNDIQAKALTVETSPTEHLQGNVSILARKPARNPASSGAKCVEKAGKPQDSKKDPLPSARFSKSKDKKPVEAIEMIIASVEKPSLNRLGSTGDDENADEADDRRRRNEERRRLDEEKDQKQHFAAKKIQSWWKQIHLIKKVELKSKSSEESTIAAHMEKYAFDLHCIPCGRRYETKEELATHFLQDSSHGIIIVEYEEFKAYQNEFAKRWQKRAETLLNTDLQDSKTVSEKNMAKPINDALSSVIVTLNFIERSRKWSDLTELKAHVLELEAACHKIEDEIALQEDNMDEDNILGSDNLHDDDNDFILVTRKKKSNRNNAKQKTYAKGNRRGDGKRT